MDVLGHAECDAGMPAGPVEDEHDLLVRPSADRPREVGQLRREEFGAHCGGQLPNRAARGWVDKADQVAPLVAVLYRGNGPLAGEDPDLLELRLEADAVLVHRPEFDLGVGERGRYLAQERPKFFLKVAWVSASAWTWRGRGTSRRAFKRCKYSHPRCCRTGRPS